MFPNVHFIVPPRVIPKNDRQSLAKDARMVTRLASKGQLRVCFGNTANPKWQTLDLPDSAVRLVVELLSYLRKGYAVSVLPHNTGLTLQQTAAVLNVSRLHLTQLLRMGRLQCYTSRQQTYVSLGDALACFARSEAIRAAVQGQPRATGQFHQAAE